MRTLSELAVTVELDEFVDLERNSHNINILFLL